jgi:hypothetical protein
VCPASAATLSHAGPPRRMLDAAASARQAPAQRSWAAQTRRSGTCRGGDANATRTEVHRHTRAAVGPAAQSARRSAASGGRRARTGFALHGGGRPCALLGAGITVELGGPTAHELARGVPLAATPRGAKRPPRTPRRHLGMKRNSSNMSSNGTVDAWPRARAWPGAARREASGRPPRGPPRRQTRRHGHACLHGGDDPEFFWQNFVSAIYTLWSQASGAASRASPTCQLGPAGRFADRSVAMALMPAALRRRLMSAHYITRPASRRVRPTPARPSQERVRQSGGARVVIYTPSVVAA